jgi:ABC-type multidrug transport system fused ATPase/permease subunit
VMESLLRQDREYFDHHQSGVLQERLNSDTEKLASTIIQQPKNLISALTRIVAKSAFLYHCSPGLFWLGISVPVPACAITITRTAHSEALTVRGTGYDADHQLLGADGGDSEHAGLEARARRRPQG